MDAKKVLEKAEKQREHRQQLLRPVAEFFHENEGEMFERYEAVEELQKYLREKEKLPLKSYNGDTGRLLHQVIGKLCDDRVDPVQNVKREGKKYVGVIEYEEHDYWYEYIEVDDIDGRRNIGVCAKCVQEAERDVEVAKGIGTTEELDKKIRDHYYEKHSEKPVGIKTGATLASGTTIAGNNAITSANDGSGSGLDADMYRGIQGENLIYPGNGYEETRSEDQGDVLSKFDSPDGTPIGMSFDSSQSVWVAGIGSDSIYKTDQNGSIIDGFSSPSDQPAGVAVDSSDNVWNADNFEASIYKLDSNGSTLDKISSPGGSPTGLGIDSDESLWVAEDSGSIFRIDQNGNIEDSFSSPSSSPEGIGIDSSGSLWNADNNYEGIYYLDRSGNELAKFKTPSNNPKGVAVATDGSVWNTDATTSSVYELKPFSEVKYE
jgi:hypothetical protein